MLAAFCFFAFLWALGFPQPMIDDLFYSGAALNLANGGDFSNPLLARQGFPSHFFFVYPPLHSYVLAAWLKLIGISAASMTAFPIVMYLIISVSTIAILRRHGALAWLEWLVPLGVAMAFLPSGLRPETLAVALLMSGFALANGTGSLRLFTGFLLMFLGSSCSPRVTIFGAALVFCAGYKLWRDAAINGLQRWAIWALGGTALILSGLIFLVLIHFRLGEFWHTFNFHAARTVGKPLALLKEYVVHVLGILQWPLVIIPFTLLIYALRKPKNDLSIIGFFTAAAFPVVAATGGIGAGTMWWLIWLMLILTGAAARRNSRFVKILLPAAVMIALLVGNRRLGANCFGLVSGRIGRDKGEMFQTALAMRPTPEHPLLLDGEVARYIFDYRIPEGALDLSFGAAFPGSIPGDRNRSELRKEDIFLAGPETVSLLTRITYLEEPTPKWFAFGLGALKFEQYPRRVYIIEPERCKGPRFESDAGKIWLPKSSPK